MNTFTAGDLTYGVFHWMFSVGFRYFLQLYVVRR